MIELEHRERRSRVDWLPLVAVLLLTLIGIAFINSATMAHASTSTLAWYKQPFVKQIVWAVVGFSCVAVLCLVDYHIIARWAMVGYWITILLLLAVFVVGSVRFGARRWIDLGPVQLQPSEFAKITTIFVLAHFLSRPQDELRMLRIFLKALGLIALPFLLILREPDLGSALIFIPVGLVMMYVAGVPGRNLLKLMGGAALLVSLMMVDVLLLPPNSRWHLIKLEDYQRRRLLVYFGRDFAAHAPPGERAQRRREQRDYSWNVEQALISVGSGGLFGKGWREGKQSSLGYLPRAVAHNDFIFSVIAEEKGFMGSVTVITLYSVLLFTGLRTAGQARDRLGKLLAVGVVALLFSHVFINIGMNIRMMPVTGVPLPLLSYGGSSVICSLIAVGILQNVHLYRRSY